MKNKVLIQALGNPSRGDDALGPLLIEGIESWWESQSNRTIQVQFEWNYQLQIEQCEHWSHFDQVVVIDAHCSLPVNSKMEFKCLESLPEIMDVSTYSSHQVSPEAILTLNHLYYPNKNPEVFILAVRGENFELKEGLSCSAEESYAESLKFLKLFLSTQRE